MFTKLTMRWMAVAIVFSVLFLELSRFSILSAQDDNFRPATTVQLPVFGVAVDPEGVLQHKQFAAAGGQIFVERARAALAVMDQDLAKKSPMRKVSLNRLLAAVQLELANEQPLPDDMLKLAGLQRIEYVFAFPDLNDVIIAGPAEGWIENAGGRAVGITSGNAVVLLEDLLTALRTYSEKEKLDTWVGCSIGTTKEGRARLAELRKEIPARVRPAQEAELAAKVVPAIEEALGNAVVTSFGIQPKTNMERVMLEADYRMKLIAIGREPAPIKMPVFIDKLKGAPKDNFQRWWFTPNYKCVEMAKDKLSLRIDGQGVQLGTEAYRTNQKGQLQKLTTKPLRAARLYSESFTKKYPEIAKAAPVFGQLRNSIDLLVIANYLFRESIFEKVGLSTELLLDEKRLPVATGSQVNEAKCMANAQWNRNTMVAPSGGVCVLAAEAFRESNLLKTDEKKLAEAADEAREAVSGHWWWD